MMKTVSVVRWATLALPLAWPLSIGCHRPSGEDLAAQSAETTGVKTQALLVDTEAARGRERGARRRPMPAPPPNLGFTDSAPAADESLVPPFVDFAYTNQRGDARYATLETNAGVRVVSGFLALWRPTSLLVDAGVTAPANGSFPAITPSIWKGIPLDPTDGTVLNAAVLDANLRYVVDVTSRRTPAQDLAAYLDDRRGKAYSVSDGMGPLTSTWRAAAQQVTSIAGVPADAATVRYDDSGNNAGVGGIGVKRCLTEKSGTPSPRSAEEKVGMRSPARHGPSPQPSPRFAGRGGRMLDLSLPTRLMPMGVGGSANASFGAVVDFVNNIGENGSTEPAKRFYKYARPWRWPSDVRVPPTLEPVKSATPGTDGGFISGHSAEAVRDAIAFAYVVPERYQEMLCRALELGENRILAGMHSPLDVMGGRIQAEAVAVASLATGANSKVKAGAYAQAHAVLMPAVNASTLAAFNEFAHSQGLDVDRFADHELNNATYLQRLTYGFAPIGDTTRTALVPKGAEVLLETRFPYLDASQRRVVLKTTALVSGYPLLDDAEGWGRLNLFAAADGYGAFNGDVVITMQAETGGFHALDTWRNDISGAGKLTKKGTGMLELSGRNTYTGGTEIVEGTLRAASRSALGHGDVYLGGGSLVATTDLAIAGDFTQLAGTQLELTAGAPEGEGLQVHGKVTIVGGALRVKLPAQRRHRHVEAVIVIRGERLQGRFSSVEVDGFQSMPIYDSDSLRLLIWR
jgi:autotransporter-associated beta strand protein